MKCLTLYDLKPYIMVFNSFQTEKPGKPDPPEIVQVNKNSVSLKWKPPKDDGGAEIFNYVIEYRIEGKVLYSCTQIAFTVIYDNYWTPRHHIVRQNIPPSSKDPNRKSFF